jgi:SAM-dependent methyltransferase
MTTRTEHEEPIALEAYQQLAEQYAARVDTKAHNAHYERPATLSLLPPVQGRRVLDAGCGPGAYAEWLVNHGAEVIAFDVSPKMVHLANERLQGRARILRADLGRPLDFLAAESFDLVLSPLVLDYVRDWGPVFKEFFRVLRRPGHFVFSAGHPGDEFYAHHDTGNYFDVEQVDYVWRGFGAPLRVPYYRRPLSAMLDPLLDAGFVLERLLEPRPLEAFKDEDPDDYERLMRRPGFICFRARKP